MSDKNPCKLYTFNPDRGEGGDKKKIVFLLKQDCYAIWREFFCCLEQGLGSNQSTADMNGPLSVLLMPFSRNAKHKGKNESQLGKFSLCCGGGAAPPTIQRSWKTKQKQKLVEDILSLFCLSLWKRKKMAAVPCSYYRITSLCIYYRLKLTTLFLTLCAPLVCVHGISLAVPKPCKSSFWGLKTMAAGRSGSPFAVDLSGSMAKPSRCGVRCRWQQQGCRTRPDAPFGPFSYTRTHSMKRSVCLTKSSLYGRRHRHVSLSSLHMRPQHADQSPSVASCRNVPIPAVTSLLRWSALVTDLSNFTVSCFIQLVCSLIRCFDFLPWPHVVFVFELHFFKGPCMMHIFPSVSFCHIHL